ncbi:hypothetical protein LTR70_005681 [Exophiala xenobiotica]|uniref:Beta-catenin-like protein 1 N-terminal domain-containing protein n=1 Tax=Lithohypha guttulata TaxID=1690604 RepID=A0ABR0KCZ9_9EURO|nr:hypothetical protein LTR24_004064 [Lithohypha guttulata]KAK5317676.1 hypothetical protein LTR70_005681 [Exophiala xenobiotica]
MSSKNDLFPKPTGSLKRKLNDPTTSFVRSSSKKATKHNEHDSPRGIADSHTPSGSKEAYVQDEPETDEIDQEAGPVLPPEDDEDGEDNAEDDEEGRFFGGGVTKEENNVLDFIEQNEDAAPDEEINLAWLKRTALNFERKINKNAELRAKFEDDPMKFVASEADLDSEIKGLSLLSEHHELYKDFVRSGCSDSLVGLLAHDNTDIAIAACQVIAELIDEDSGVPAEEWSLLVKSMLKAELLDLLVSNLGRLEETVESDTAGVYHVLNVMENLLSDGANAEKLGSQTKLLEWLLLRVKHVDDISSHQVSQNRQYAAEIMVILAQNHDKNASRLVKLGAVDTILQLLSMWRRRDPEKDSDEEEFAENLFDCLATIVKGAAGCEKFIEDEGLELCLIMLKEGKFSRNGSLRILDHAAGGAAGGTLCEHLVEAGGLKQLFTTFMKSKKLERQSTEHVIGILASMLRFLPAGSAARIRTLAKFVEKEYEKCDRLIELWQEYKNRLKIVDTGIDRERMNATKEEADANEDEWSSRRMDAGLFPLQTLHVILAWLIAEDDGARKSIAESMEKQDRGGLDAIRKSLQEQLDGIEVEATDEAVSTRDMLDALIRCLL